jgi:hypothetical protein
MLKNFLTPKLETEVTRANDSLELIASYLKSIAESLVEIAAAPNFLPSDMGLDLEHTPGDPGPAEVLNPDDPDPDEEREGVEPKPDPHVFWPNEEREF